MKFAVTIHVKPYVKCFLENNYGNPVNFSSHPREQEAFMRMLKKPCKDYDRKYEPDLNKYPCTVTVEISERLFYRHGWEISKTDAIAFGKAYEKKSKMLMRTVVGIYISFGMPINVAIYKFQKRFKMDDDSWSFEAIKKDFFRYRSENSIDFQHNAYQHLEELILVNMYNAGVLTKSLVRDFEEQPCQSE